VGYAWRRGGAGSPGGSSNDTSSAEGGPRTGRALHWWLKQLRSPATRAALLCHPGRQPHLGVESIP